jgi:lauroyl/myristoyl acyltransferase
MPRDTLRRIRRAATQRGIQLAIAATASLPVNAQRKVVRSLVGVAGRVPMLRRRVREAMRLGLGHEPPAGADRLYFQNVGWFLSSALAIFHNGLMGTSVPHEVIFDDTMQVLDKAVAEGRGVVLTAAHWSGHELAAACIGQRHPVAMLVRDASTPERTERKLRWYSALRTETVLRPSGSSPIKDAVAYLKILKQGKLLAMTPDLLADAGQGVEVSIFGRTATLHGGAFALALAARAPLIRVYGVWKSANSVLIRFERAPDVDLGDREAAVRAAVQDWCRWFEEKVRANPENWLFWLDKRWSRFLRAVPPASGAA